MRIGDLRHRVELQAFTTIADGMGGGTATWSTEDTVRAAIWPVSVSEQVKAGSPTMVATHKVRIRYNEDLRAEWRVKFGDRYFSIVSIVNKDEKNAQMDLLCREVVA
jgi:SPP1 family predicted phage head-tail adaptor